MFVKNGVANVSAATREEWIQFEAYRHSTDEMPVDDSGEERRTNGVVGQVTSYFDVGEGVQPRLKTEVRIEVEEKRHARTGEVVLGRSGGWFIGGHERSKHYCHETNAITGSAPA